MTSKHNSRKHSHNKQTPKHITVRLAVLLVIGLLLFVAGFTCHAYEHQIDKALEFVIAVLSEVIAEKCFA